jgi:hypothetical protein
MIYRYPSDFHFLKNVVKLCPRANEAGGLGLEISGGPSRTDVGLMHSTSTVSVRRYSRSPWNGSQHNLQFKLEFPQFYSNYSCNSLISLNIRYFIKGLPCSFALCFGGYYPSAGQG